MSRPLDREGIFKARPFTWEVYRAESGAVGVSIGFEITAKLSESYEWDDWSEYEAHHCYGTWWVVKKDGSINQGPVEQLAAGLGWKGDLMTVSKEPVPEVIVQITVKEDTYNGKTRYRAAWMNPGEYAPTSSSTSPEDVQQLQARFGSLLRAAASGASRPSPAPAVAVAVASGEQDDDIPF